MLALLAVFAVGAVAAPLLVAWWGRRAFYVMALIPAAALGWAIAQTGPVVAGSAKVEQVSWVPQLGLTIAVRMNALSWLLVLLVTGVGALVLVYCARYFGPTEAGLGRFAGAFVGFAGAMFGLVVSDDLILLYVFWELTTVFSYLLIGQSPQSVASRRAASSALIVTTFGGLAMLVGLITLAVRAGTTRLSGIVAEPPPSDGVVVAAVVLILVGALSKSAIWPFSFWLPAAMAAPTPVSAYLHAAAMVKAGIYLVAVLAPFFAGVDGWQPIVLVGGAVTMLMGGWSALRQTDLKRLLAYGTVSQLGLLLAAVGLGSADAALAGAAMLVAHALFKATLFLVVGIIDHQAATRDLTELSGLWRAMPWTFAVACLAAASMAGLPPFFGFVAKEAVFGAFLPEGATLAALVAGSVLTVAYTARFLWGGFASKAGGGPVDKSVHEAGPMFLAAPAVLAVAGLALVPLAGRFTTALAPYTSQAGVVHEKLALWHGFTPALGLSALALVGGAVMIAGRGVVARAVAALRAPRDGAWSYGRIVHGLERSAVELTASTQRGSLPFYLGTILIALIVAAGVALLAGIPWASTMDHLVGWNNPVELVAGALTVVTAIFAVRTRRRLTTMLLVGLTGYGTAALFVLHGAPDLALTQFLVETVSIVVFVLVLRRLPTHFSSRLWRRTRWVRRGLGAATGLLIAILAVVAISSRQSPPISNQFPAAATEFGGGRNVVNVTLVDIRAWDTMGEISVLVVGATGVASLIFIRPRTGPSPRRGQAPRASGKRPAGRRSWLAGAKALPHGERSIILEVATRLLFHPLVLYSLYLLFSGHNAPGGGFSGGLMAGMALAIRYLAGGRHELNEAAPIDAGLLLASGLLLSVGTGIIAMLLGGQVLQSAQIDLHLPVVGDVHLITSLFFDIGVYLVVVGLVLEVLRSLGGEIDRHSRTPKARPVRTKKAA